MMVTAIRDFYLSEEGATAIEYGLIAALIAVGIMTALGEFSRENAAVYQYVENAVTNVVQGNGS